MASCESILSEITGRSITSICSNGVKYFKFNEICKDKRVFGNFLQERKSRFLKQSNSYFVDFAWTIESLFKQKEYHDNILKCFCKFVEINSTNVTNNESITYEESTTQTSISIPESNNSGTSTQIYEQSISSQSNNEIMVDEIYITSELNSNPSSTNNSEQGNTRNTRKKRKKSEISKCIKQIDKENIEKASKIVISERNISKEREQKNKRKSNKKKKKQFEPCNNTIQKKERRERYTKIVNEKLGDFRKIDEKKYTKVNLGKINLVSDDENRNTFIIHNSFKRPDFENSLEQSKTKCDVFMEVFSEIANLCNIELTHLFHSFFRKNITYAMNIFNSLIACKRHPVADEKVYNEFQRMNRSRNTPSIQKQLKTKDEMGCSDAAWKEFVLLANRNMKASLTEETKKYNQFVVEYFNFQQVKNGFRVKLLPLVKAAVKAHLHQIAIRKEKGLPIGKEINFKECIEGGISLPKDLKLKVSMDGRELGNLTTVVVTLQMLNLCTYASQDPKSVIPICMYVGEESEVMSYMKDFEKEVQELAENGLTIQYEENDASLGFQKMNNDNQRNTVTVPCEFYWVSDMKSLAYVSILREDDHFCFECDCERSNSVMSLVHGDVCNHREIEHKFKIRNVYFCVLHMDERITEYIMKMTLIGSKAESIILSNLKRIHGFSSFSFSTKERIEQAMNISEYSFMFTGSHCARIFGNIDFILGFVKENHNNLWKIWQGWRNIRKWIFLTNEELNEKSNEDFKKLKQEIQEWGKEIQNIRKSSGSVGDYIHIVVNHLFKFLTTIGSLLPFSNQGVENSHKYDRWLMDRCVSRGKKNIGTKNQGKSNTFLVEDTSSLVDHLPNHSLPEFTYNNIVQKTSDTSWNNLYMIAQILLKKYRILYLSFTAEDVVFKRLELRVGSVIKAFWERDTNICYPPTSFDSESYESPIGVYSTTSGRSITEEDARMFAFHFETSMASPSFHDYSQPNETPAEDQLLYRQYSFPNLSQVMVLDDCITNNREDVLLNPLRIIRSDNQPLMTCQDEDDEILYDNYFNENNYYEHVDEEDPFDWDTLGCVDNY